MSSLGIPANLQATCGGSGTMNITWTETPPSCTFAASGPTEVTKNSQHQYSAANGLGTVSWGVGGIGASITQGGLLTLDGTACGMVTVTATDSVCGASQVQARVTNGGVWVLVSTQYAAPPSGTYAQPANYGCNGLNCQSCLGGGNGTWSGACGCNVVSGGYRTDYYTVGICLCQVSQSGYDAGYRDGAYPSAGSAPCTGGKPDNPCLDGCGCSVDSFGGIPRICSSISYTFATYMIETREWRCA